MSNLKSFDSKLSGNFLQTLLPFIQIIWTLKSVKLFRFIYVGTYLVHHIRLFRRDTSGRQIWWSMVQEYLGSKFPCHIVQKENKIFYLFCPTERRKMNKLLFLSKLVWSLKKTTKQVWKILWSRSRTSRIHTGKKYWDLEKCKKS